MSRADLETVDSMVPSTGGSGETTLPARTGLCGQAPRWVAAACLASVRLLPNHSSDEDMHGGRIVESFHWVDLVILCAVGSAAPGLGYHTRLSLQDHD